MSARRVAALAAFALLAAAGAPQAAALADPPAMRDDFEAGVGPLWQTILGGYASGLCGSSSGTQALLFETTAATRQAVTVPLAIEPADTLAFFWRGVHSSCSDMEEDNRVLVQYSAAGAAWQTLVEIVPTPQANAGLKFVVPLPPQAIGSATQFRWIQPGPGSNTDEWYLDDVAIGSGHAGVHRGTTTQQVPGSDVGTPTVTTPAACALGPCTEPTQESTPEVELVPAGFCVPPTGPLLCFDESLTLNPQTTPAVPAVCDVADPACVPPTTVNGVRLVRGDAAKVRLVWTAILVDYDGHVDDRAAHGPFHVPIDLSPLADPTVVTLCPETCDLPVAPEGSASGLVTLEVTAAGETETVTIPVAL